MSVKKGDVCWASLRAIPASMKWPGVVVDASMKWPGVVVDALHVCVDSDKTK